jgi:CheY-like chemotaxis protein
MNDANNNKVLVVEDNLVNQKVAVLLLQQLGLAADVVDGGRKALEAVEGNGSYAIILMDCQMPEMDGFQTTKAIRRLESARGTYTPIVAVTALAMVGDRERCIAAGMDDYISKPIDRNVLKVKLNHWMKREFVEQNQALILKFTQPPVRAAPTEHPINMSELEEFFAHDADDVLSTFVYAADRLLREMNSAINERRDTDLAHMAHELKGASASIGAKALAKLSMYLERAAGIGDWTEARDTFAAVVTAFASVKQFLQERQANLPAEASTLPARD